MGVFLGVLFFILLVLAIAISIFLIRKYKKRTIAVICSAISAAFLLMFIFIPFGFVQVQSGQVAVVRQWGKVTSNKTAGLHFRNIISEQYIIYDTKIQQMNIEKWCYVKDSNGTTQVIQVVSSVQFSLNEVNVMDVAIKYGTMDALRQRVNTVILGALETAAAQYSIDELVTGLGKLDYQNKIKHALTEDNSVNGLTVENQFYITFSQIIIEEFILEPALEEAMLDVRLAEAKRKEREEQLKKETAEVEAIAKQDQIRAEAAREIERLNAENDILVKELLAMAKLVEATGEADALIERARGEAEVLRLKSIELARSIGINIITDGEGNETIDSTDPNIGILSEYLEYIAYLEAWDGKLPEIVGDWNILLPIQP